MEYGFYHPERGYWQTTNEPPHHILDSYPDGTVEVPLKPSADHVWNGSGWVHTPPDPSELLAQERAAMSCSRMQGILTLGEEKWGEVLAYRETATWAERVIIDASGQWERVSENIEFIGYLVGYNDEQMDDLFRAAMQVQA